MALIAVDVGGTKIAGALFSKKGKTLETCVDSVSGQKGPEIGQVIIDQIQSLSQLAADRSEPVEAIGVCVPGIFDPGEGTVWAPNLSGWESYPLLEEIRSLAKDIPVSIDSDRSCYILGEMWKGNAQGCENAIFIAIGTGIGAGILVDGKVLRGIGNSAGAIGWMALDRPHRLAYSRYGCFEYHASGEGLARMAREYLSGSSDYQGTLSGIAKEELTARDIFAAYEQGDPIAEKVIRDAIEFWSMAIANLVSIFNPGKIILGGGVSDAAAPLLEQIKTEAKRWAQPIGFGEVSIELAGLGSDAGIYGAAYLALSACNKKSGV